MSSNLNSNLNFKEMSHLYIALCDAGIPCEVRELWDGLQICYPNAKDCICDAICHSGSYGHERGLLEIMGLVDEEKVGDSVEGYLTALEVFKRISNHWHSEEKQHFSFFLKKVQLYYN